MTTQQLFDDIDKLRRDRLVNSYALGGFMENATALDALIREIGVEALAQFQAGQGGLIEDVVKPIERLRDLVPTLFDHDLVDILGGIRALSQLDTRLVPFTIVSTARKLGEEAAKPIPMML